VCLGRGEDEHDVFGRFLERLKERVERRGRQHVNLIDDVDLLASSRGGKGDPRKHVSGLVDLRVRSRVHLDDVQRRSLGDRNARIALAAGFGCRSLDAVQCLREKAGHRGLARSPRPREQVRVSNPILGDGVRERLRYVLLAEDLGECLWSVLAIKGEVSHVASS
jgi:hypothetical protein